MKKFYSSVSVISLALTLSACSGGQESSGAVTVTEVVTLEPGAAETIAAAAASEDDLVDVATDGLVQGKIGYKHGIDCSAPGDCAFSFTVESMDFIDTCDDYIMSHTGQPEGTRLLKTVLLVEASPSEAGWNPGQFPIWSDWSAVDESGINQTLPKSEWCYNSNPADAWQNEIRVGDTERRVHYMDIPDGTESIRLTETDSYARWEWDTP